MMGGGANSPKGFSIEKIEEVEQLAQVIIERCTRDEDTMDRVECFESIEDQAVIGFD